jgi:kynurenine formamidase
MCSPEVLSKVKEAMPRRHFLGMVGALALGGAASGVKLPDQPRAPYRFATTGKVADLTHVFRPDFPLFGGGQAIDIKTVVTVKDNGFYVNRLSYDEHAGTHMDAPAHFTDGGTTAENLDPQMLVAPLAVVNISERAAKDADTMLMVDDLMAWEKANGKLPTGAVVAMYSGWEARVGSEKEFRNLDASNVMHFPGFSPEAAEFLIKERDIVGIGVDTLSLDFGGSTDFKVHLTVLPAGKYGLENLANLASVPALGATIVVGSPKHTGASGGPTRVLAMY